MFTGSDIAGVSRVMTAFVYVGIATVFIRLPAFIIWAIVWAVNHLKVV